MKGLLAVAVLVICRGAVALELLDVQGLAITVDRMPQPVSVDGVRFEIQAARGADVRQLARRIEAQWLAEGSDLQRIERDGWQMLGRLRGHVSELIQWRGPGAGSLLLHSEADLGRQVHAPAAAPFALPPRCAWGRVIEERAQQRPYAQRTGYCRDRPAVLVPLLRTKLAAQGWIVHEGGSGSLQLSDGRSAGSLSITASPEVDGSALVWVAALEKEDGSQ